MRGYLIKEAKYFDKINNQREKNGISPLLNTKKIYNYFYNNPWRYPETRQISIKRKIKFIEKNLKKKDKILECGCGNGVLSLELGRKGYNITGIDVSKKSILIAKKYAKKIKNSKLNFQNKSIEDFKNSKNIFDVIVFFKTFHHLKNPNKILKILRKILKKNGKLLMIEPVRGDMNELNFLIIFLIRNLAEEWRQINLNFNIVKNLKKIKKEYNYVTSKKGFDQSHMDNAINKSKDIIKALKNNKFKILDKKFDDSIKDKIIGGLSGKKRVKLVKFVDNLDQYLISNNITNGSTIKISAKKL